MTFRDILQAAADAYERGDYLEAIRLIDEARYIAEGEVEA